MLIDKIELIYKSDEFSRSDNSMFITAFTEYGNEFNCEIKFEYVSTLEIMRVRKDYIDEDSFKHIVKCGINCIRNGTWEKTVDRMRQHNSLRRYNLCAKRHMLYYSQPNLSDDETINFKYIPKSFSETLSLAGLHINIYNVDTKTQQNTIFDEHYNKINYKKLFLQKIFGNYEFRDYVNWDIYNDDCYCYELYFELHDYRYGILCYP
ncbi:MAG: hypothetical protein Gaeavirus4_12 [Gaeavirus sp.]|uniref:Uncharacterized protein n=1 Tax=Gaeavirus sp. TaxID=2487767 RepID=A0A3G5A3E5_9VIRU|nr:MAG: hypothetical protein Gaeavirus4_12 [Gaeavirus sp.]